MLQVAGGAGAFGYADNIEESIPFEPLPGAGELPEGADLDGNVIEPIVNFGLSPAEVNHTHVSTASWFLC